jgi:hypothetical protein
MSETPFFKTRMGQQFYERTMPELVKQLQKLNDLLEILTTQHHSPHEEIDADDAT